MNEKGEDKADPIYILLAISIRRFPTLQQSRNKIQDTLYYLYQEKQMTFATRFSSRSNIKMIIFPHKLQSLTALNGDNNLEVYYANQLTSLNINCGATDIPFLVCKKILSVAFLWL